MFKKKKNDDRGVAQARRNFFMKTLCARLYKIHHLAQPEADAVNKREAAR